MSTETVTLAAGSTRTSYGRQTAAVCGSCDHLALAQALRPTADVVVTRAAASRAAHQGMKCFACTLRDPSSYVPATRSIRVEFTVSETVGR